MPATPLRIAMLGLIEGNGHPFSWSAIINGYDPAFTDQCPPVITQYLAARSPEEVRIPGAAVTHIWTDRPGDALAVAKFARIPHIAAKMEDVIGEVDAVIIATDDGTDHARRARPFVEAGLPVFVDKPLATTLPELRQFAEWQADGAKILSSSGMRYAAELDTLKDGSWDWISGVTCKSLERYGIHALEPIFKIFGPGFELVHCTSHHGQYLVHATHRGGSQATLAVLEKAIPCIGAFHAYGTAGHRTAQVLDTYSAFRGQLVTATEWFRSGLEPFPFAHTVEMMGVIIAALRSREQGGAIVSVPGVLAECLPACSH